MFRGLQLLERSDKHDKCFEIANDRMGGQAERAHTHKIGITFHVGRLKYK